MYFQLVVLSATEVLFCCLALKRHQKRESEPVDFPLWSGDKPNLQRSTYKLLAKNIPSDVIYHYPYLLLIGFTMKIPF